MWPFDISLNRYQRQRKIEARRKNAEETGLEGGVMSAGYYTYSCQRKEPLSVEALYNMHGAIQRLENKIEALEAKKKR